MNQTHLHLLITHLPIVGTILGSLVLAYGSLSKSTQTKLAAYGLLILSTIGAIVSYLTGEAAEEGVEHIQGIAKSAIDRHEDFAAIGLTALVVLGIISILGVLTIKKPNLSAKISYLALFISLISFALIGWTGYLGGQIRHTEINKSTDQLQQDKTEKKDD